MKPESKNLFETLGIKRRSDKCFLYVYAFFFLLAAVFNFMDIQVPERLYKVLGISAISIGTYLFLRHKLD